MIMLPKDYISVSQVLMYQRCPKQYAFRYIDNIVYPPAVALIEGKSHHKALELNNVQKIESHEDLKPETVVEKFCDTFSDSASDIEDWESETKDGVIARGKGLLETYMQSVSPTIQPVAVEREFHLPLSFSGNEVDVMGFIDVEQNDGLADYKVVARTKSQADVDNDLQLAVYGCVTNKSSAENICMVKTKTPKIERVKTEITPERGQWAAYVMSEVVKAISTGAFPPCDPTSWCCSEQFCGYWKHCRGKGKA